jgi:hypothetical protein
MLQLQGLVLFIAAVVGVQGSLHEEKVVITFHEDAHTFEKKLFVTEPGSHLIRIKGLSLSDPFSAKFAFHKLHSSVSLPRDTNGKLSVDHAGTDGSWNSVVHNYLGSSTSSPQVYENEGSLTSMVLSSAGWALNSVSNAAKTYVRCDASLRKCQQTFSAFDNSELMIEGIDDDGGNYLAEIRLSVRLDPWCPCLFVVGVLLIFGFFEMFLDRKALYFYGGSAGLLLGFLFVLSMMRNRVGGTSKFFAAIGSLFVPSSIGYMVNSCREYVGYYAVAYPVQFGMFWMCWILFGIGVVHMILYRGGEDDGQLSRGSKDILSGLLRLAGMVCIAYSSHSAYISFWLTLFTTLLWATLRVMFPDTEENAEDDDTFDMEYKVHEHGTQSSVAEYEQSRDLCTQRELAKLMQSPEFHRWAHTNRDRLMVST